MKAKKLTLNETWVLCLKMWRWIAKQKRAGTEKDVDLLKSEWFEKNWVGGYVESHCFFCKYVEDRNGDCDMCPGILVDETFNCEGRDYDYFEFPIPFYNKLVSLNKRRRLIQPTRLTRLIRWLTCRMKGGNQKDN